MLKMLSRLFNKEPESVSSEERLKITKICQYLLENCHHVYDTTYLPRVMQLIGERMGLSITPVIGVLYIKHNGVTYKSKHGFALFKDNVIDIGISILKYNLQNMRNPVDFNLPNTVLFELPDEIYYEASKLIHRKRVFDYDKYFTDDTLYKILFDDSELDRIVKEISNYNLSDWSEINPSFNYTQFYELLMFEES